MHTVWNSYFSKKGVDYVLQNIDLALAEDGEEMTARGIFPPTAHMCATIRAKEASLVVGLPLVGLVLKRLSAPFTWKAFVAEGAHVPAMTNVARITGQAYALLKAERCILNYICHLSGIANLTARYVKELEGTGVSLLDTRKTTPGLRYLEKYAVAMGGGKNHRMDLTEMLMLKDNHIDALGSITAACECLRRTYTNCPPIEVECRTKEHVLEAVHANADRIMLDNMSNEQLKEALGLIPEEIEAEVSGNVSLETIGDIARIGPRHPNFISVGRITHSAPAADFSMTVTASPS